VGLRPIAGKSGSFYVEEFDIVVEASDILSAIVNGGISNELAMKMIYARARDRKEARDGYAPEPPREFKVVDERKRCTFFLSLSAIGMPVEGARCELPSNHAGPHSGVFPNNDVRYRWSGSKVWTETDPFGFFRPADDRPTDQPKDVSVPPKPEPEPEPESSQRSRALAVAEELEEDKPKGDR
jgi:hypothetical protein